MAPAIVAGLLLVWVQPVLAQLTGEQMTQLQNFVASQNVEVGGEIRDGWSRVYYVWEGEKHEIPVGSMNAKSPVTAGRYIAFVKEVNGAGQIVRYDILTEESVQLTLSSTNLLPQVNRAGFVTWERWSPELDGWQVYLFDGTQVFPLAGGTESMNAALTETEIVYSAKGWDNLWHVLVYKLATKEIADVDSGVNVQKPRIVDGEVVYQQAGGSEQAFVFSLEEIFELKYGVLPVEPEVATSAAQVTEATVTAELEASPSGIILEASSAASPTP